MSPYNNTDSQLDELQKLIKDFCEERDWNQFHGPKDLAIGLVTEASELLEHFRFQSDDHCIKLLDQSESREKIEDELADGFFFILRFAQKYNIDLDHALKNKMAKNANKYPVELSKGSNKKYTDFHR